MRLHAHHIGDEVQGDYEEQDEENWGCRTPGVGFHHHIWVAGEEEKTDSSTNNYMPAVYICQRATYKAKHFYSFTETQLDLLGSCKCDKETDIRL